MGIPSGQIKSSSGTSHASDTAVASNEKTARQWVELIARLYTLAATREPG